MRRWISQRSSQLPCSHGRCRSGSSDRGERGAVLIIALGVLTIMAVLGTAFAQLMRLERAATDNYLEARQMDFLLETGLSRAIAELQGAKNFRSFSVYTDNPWLYRLRDEDTMAHGRVDMNNRRVSRWEMFARRSGVEQWINTKVIDCASQINLNGRQDTLARMLDNLGQAIDSSERLKRGGRKITNPFYEGPNRSGQRIRGADIVRLRRRLPGGQFTSKTQLRQLIGDENYEIVKDFVTCYGWLDSDVFGPLDGLNEVPELLGSTGGLGGSSAQQSQPPASAQPRMERQPRYPVNLNTAPEEVLIACLQGLAGRRVFPFSFLGGGAGINATMAPQVDAGAQILGRRLTAQEEVGSVLPRAIFVYSPRLEYQHAKRLAEQIIVRRKIRPFMAWRTNDQGRQGFEDFVDLLETSFFPSPTNALVIDPDQPNNQQIKRALVSGGATSPVGRLWIKGTDVGSTRGTYRQAGIGFHDQNAWYYELVKGVLKANFNPNTRINRYNPNAAVYVPVDKSDLVWAQDNFNLFKGNTTEFAFDSMGYYEITSLGQIGPISDRTAQSSTTTSSRGRGQLGMPVPFRRPFERRVRTVVQTYGVLRHTNQYHFEKTFQGVGALSSVNNRKNVVTWPEPMEALTELVTAGSVRDGRIEVAGLLDGRRMEGAYLSRPQTYRASHPSITVTNGFDSRPSQSLSRLRRVKQGGSTSLFTEEFTDALRDLFDAPFSRFGARMDKFYRRAEVLNYQAYTNEAAIPRDPLINKEVLGTDVFPDGLHSSIVRTSHIASRHLSMPARQRIDLGREESGVVKVGASGLGSRGQNTLGNVPYYRGGIGFWVKFEFNGDDPVFSGLVSSTQVVREVSQNGADFSGSEGSQFYIFKNSIGQLRVVRMYYHQAFLHSIGEGGDGVSQLYPQVIADNESNPILELLDPQKIISRTDIMVPIRHFKAHEWHHIAIDWDDQNPNLSVRLYVDFQESRAGGGPIHAQGDIGSANSWVRLNERQPKDGLHIGGFIREQGDSNYGLFKWYTNSTSAGQGRGGIVEVERNVKRFMANATIDEFIVFDGAFPGVKNYLVAQSPGYYTNRPCEYANVFDVPLPPSVDSIMLRSFDWTSYYPAMFTDSLPQQIPQPLRRSDMQIQAEVVYLPVGNSTIPGGFIEPWQLQEPVNRIAGRRAARRATGVQGDHVKVGYRFRFQAAKGVTGNTSGGSVATPVIDDVTLTYFLPTPKIHLQEEVE